MARRHVEPFLGDPSRDKKVDLARPERCDRLVLLLDRHADLLVHRRARLAVRASTAVPDESGWAHEALQRRDALEQLGEDRGVVPLLDKEDGVERRLALELEEDADEGGHLGREVDGRRARVSARRRLLVLLEELLKVHLDACAAEQGLRLVETVERALVDRRDGDELLAG